MKTFINLILLCSSTMFLWTVINSVDLQCKSTGFQCVNETTFVVCVDIGNDVLVPTPSMATCPEDFECNDEYNIPCVEQSTTIPTSKLITNPNIEPFTCLKAGKFAAPNCQQYFHCIDLIFWFKLKIKTCAPGLWFSDRLQKCVLQHMSECKPLI